MQLKFEQDFQAVFDPSKIGSGAESLEALGIDIGIGTATNGHSTAGVIEHSWRPVPTTN